MDLTVKNVAISNETALEIAQMLSQAHVAFAACSVEFGEPDAAPPPARFTVEGLTVIDSLAEAPAPAMTEAQVIETAWSAPVEVKSPVVEAAPAEPAATVEAPVAG